MKTRSLVIFIMKNALTFIQNFVLEILFSIFVEMRRHNISIYSLFGMTESIFDDYSMTTQES